MRHGKILQVAAHLGLETVEQYHDWLIKKYQYEHMSSHEIHEYIMAQMPKCFKYSPRSIQRTIKSALLSKGLEPRGVRQAFNIAIKKGRMNYDHQKKVHKTKRNHLKPAKRYAILKRDGFKCVLCGATAESAVLEVDHIVAYVHGGKHTDENMRTLCWNCNTGKRIIEGEK